MWRIPVGRYAVPGDGSGRWLACHNQGAQLFTVDEKKFADKMNISAWNFEEQWIGCDRDRAMLSR
jgi:hypothetical protein